MKKTSIFILIILLDIIVIIVGYRKNNIAFKVIGYILLIPILFTMVSLIYLVFST